jgi:hypothetical protein
MVTIGCRPQLQPAADAPLKAGVDPDAPNLGSQKRLSAAIDGGTVALVQTLSSKGAEGTEALNTAIKTWSIAMAQALVASGAKPGSAELAAVRSGEWPAETRS